MDEFQPLTLQGAERCFEGRWKLLGETLELEIGEMRFTVESDGDLARNVKRMERILGRSFFHQQVRFKTCLNCEHFQMSSMAREMGRGQRGVCWLHQRLAEICEVCTDYK